MDSYRFYSGGSRIWTHTDSTVVDPEFGLIQILQWWIQEFGLIQILQWWIKDLDSYRFYSGGS